MAAAVQNGGAAPRHRSAPTRAFYFSMHVVHLVQSCRACVRVSVHLFARQACKIGGFESWQQTLLSVLRRTWGNNNNNNNSNNSRKSDRAQGDGPDTLVDTQWRGHRGRRQGTLAEALLLAQGESAACSSRRFENQHFLVSLDCCHSPAPFCLCRSRGFNSPSGAVYGPT